MLAVEVAGRRPGKGVVGDRVAGRVGAELGIAVGRMGIGLAAEDGVVAEQAVGVWK